MSSTPKGGIVNPEPFTQILWVHRANGRFPSAIMLRHILRGARLDAYIEDDLHTRSRVAISVITEQHVKLVTRLLSENGWVVDKDYAPTEEDVAEREHRERLKSFSLRPTVTLSNEYVDELFGKESPYRRRHWNSRY